MRPCSKSDFCTFTDLQPKKWSVQRFNVVKCIIFLSFPGCRAPLHHIPHFLEGYIYNVFSPHHKKNIPLSSIFCTITENKIFTRNLPRIGKTKTNGKHLFKFAYTSQKLGSSYEKISSATIDNHRKRKSKNSQELRKTNFFWLQ